MSKREKEIYKKGYRTAIRDVIAMIILVAVFDSGLIYAIIH